MISKISILANHENEYVSFIFTYHQISFIYILEKIPGIIIFFSVNQFSDNHHILGNKEKQCTFS